MLKTWAFWKRFITTYLALLAGIWGFVEAYTYFEGDSLKQIFGLNWWIYYYIIPLFLAILFSASTFSNESGHAESLDQYERRVMLNHVENFWVKGILEKSLHGVAILELEIKEESTAVEYPWTIKKHPTNETIPAGKPMLQIFNEIGLSRSLLILGAPGSGKTTMLLELTRQLIESARKNESEPIPVVFNLASWKDKQLLVDWLADQLNILYYVPKKTAQKIAKENKMFLLLDGLDEVKQDLREKCIGAINEFKNAHGLTSLVVCSRTEEYQAINKTLSLAGAITLQPVTSEQMDTYFNRFGKSLAGVRKLLEKDALLRELAETPLMLSTIALTYKNKNMKELKFTKDKDVLQKKLFDTYIEQMFEYSSRSKNRSFTKAQTLQYLSWLARKMIQNNLVAYQIESMQPNWLDNDRQQKSFMWASRVFAKLIGIILFVVLFGLIGGPWIGLFFGFPLGLLVDFTIKKNDSIQMVDTFKWSWFHARLGVFFGFLFGVILELIFAVLFKAVLGVATIFLISLIFGIFFGLREVQVEETRHPEQRIKQTFYIKSIRVFLLGLIVGVLSVSLYSQLGGLLYGVSRGITYGLVVMIFNFSKEIAPLINHFSLRNTFINANLLPRSLVPFLDHAVDLIFLRRVGGSYIFVHRLLMEHFAEMEAEKL